MLRKIILPLVLVIFTQQNFYGMEKKEKDGTLDTITNRNPWETTNCWVNMNLYTYSAKSSYPKLWLLWAILDNVPFQYGGSKIWKHGEAYYGLSNGIGFFPSFLNFGWLKIGFVDAHINVINLVLDYFKNYIQLKYEKQTDIPPFLIPPIGVNLIFNIHIFSFKILNCIKIKLVAPLTLLPFFVSNDSATYIIGTKEGEKKGTAWYITYNENGQISWWYALLSPRIEINIAGIIDLF